jgi:WD40 repeat protein
VEIFCGKGSSTRGLHVYDDDVSIIPRRPFHPGGTTEITSLAFGGRGGSVGLLTVADPAHAREFVPDPDGYHATVPMVCLSFAPYSTTTLAIAGSPTGSILMWNWSEPNPENQVRNVLVGHTAIVESVVFAAGGRLLVSAGDDGTIRFWPMS